MWVRIYAILMHKQDINILTFHPIISRGKLESQDCTGYRLPDDPLIKTHFSKTGKRETERQSSNETEKGETVLIWISGLYLAACLDIVGLLV